MSHEKRRWFRSKPRGLGTASAKLLVAGKNTPIECTVVDLSAGGACLEFSIQPSLPDRFEFLHSGVKKLARLAWRRGYRIGISFDSSTEKAISSSSLSRPSRLRFERA
jgi:hypothetical protein